MASEALQANQASAVQGDRYLENTHCEGSIFLQLVVGAVLGLGWLPCQPVFVPPAAHVLEGKTARSLGARTAGVLCGSGLWGHPSS